MAQRMLSAEVLLQRAVFFPAVALLLFMLGFEGVRMINAMQQEQAGIAKYNKLFRPNESQRCGF
jgi:hypothetical protein